MGYEENDYFVADKLKRGSFCSGRIGNANQGRPHVEQVPALLFSAISILIAILLSKEK